MAARPGMIEKKTREAFEYERDLRDEFAETGNI